MERKGKSPLKKKQTYDIILAIQPQYVDRIFSGSKLYEYRRNIPKQEINKVYIYATIPVKKVVGYFTFSTIIHQNINTLWAETQALSGITKEDFFRYFSGKEMGYAYHIKKVVQFKTPQNLTVRPPQSFFYYSS